MMKRVTKNLGRWLFLFIFVVPNVNAASVKFLGIESILVKPQHRGTIHAHAIVVASGPKAYKRDSIRFLDRLPADLVYQTRISFDGKLYYRLVFGNYDSRKKALGALAAVKKYYADAWVVSRDAREIRHLNGLLSSKSGATTGTGKKPARRELSGNLLEQAKEEFLNKNDSRVLAITDRIIRESASSEQIQQAMELAGVVRERRQQFAQAIAIYEDFLDIYGDSEMAPKIESRLTGLRTMLLEPRERLGDGRDEPAKWNVYGAISQYYREDVIESEDRDDNDIKHSAFYNDIDLLASRKAQDSTLQLRFNGGLHLVDDEDDTQSDLDYAYVSYTHKPAGFLVSGGRQKHAASGIFGRFDGLVFQGLPGSGFNYSFYAGYPVISTYESNDTERRFVGANLRFRPSKRFDTGVYILQQEIAGFTDRQAIGTEFGYRADRGYIFGLVDYDLFHQSLANFSLVGNYVSSEQLSFNMGYQYYGSPLLTSSNALAGQAVTSMDELKALFSEREIIQLAEDRTVATHHLNVGSNYRIDGRRNLYLGLSYFLAEETTASAGVAASPKAEEVNFSADYSVNGFFSSSDHTSMGIRLSNTETANVLSLDGRSYFGASGSLRYGPGLRLDYRDKRDSDEDYWILNPSLGMTYRRDSRLSFDVDLGIELTRYDQSHLDGYRAYNLTLGYVYRF